jgi:hypothetical protein
VICPDRQSMSSSARPTTSAARRPSRSRVITIA